MTRPRLDCTSHEPGPVVSREHQHGYRWDHKAKQWSMDEWVGGRVQYEVPMRAGFGPPVVLTQGRYGPPTPDACLAEYDVTASVTVWAHDEDEAWEYAVTSFVGGWGYGGEDPSVDEVQRFRAPLVGGAA